MSSRRTIPAPLWRLCLLTLPTLVASFGTVNEPNILGQHNEHEMVTRLAFQCPEGQKSDGICFEPASLDQLAGYHLDVYGIPIIGGGFNGAVGSPDTLDPIPEGPEAHCDDADFIDIPGYPQKREAATAALQTCVDHLRGRFRQAWGSAQRLLDEDGRIRKDMVELSNLFGGDCVFAFPSLQINLSGRAKCDVIEGFGRALHGVQDFYAHSNWVDKSDPSQPISDVNPPGLARTDRAPFIVDLGTSGAIPPDQIPLNLSTGCFVLPDKTPGDGDCTGRATHHTLTKDHGIIHRNGTFGTVGPDTPRAESVPENFKLAVQAAVEASRDLWDNFRAELQKQYGTSKGDLMICSVVRDDPINDCRHRAVSVVLDKSRISKIHKTSEMERLAAQALTSKMAPDSTDKLTVIEFDETAEVVFPWVKPVDATIKQFETTGRHSNISGGLALAIDEITKAYPDTHINRGAVVLFTAGPGSRNWEGDTVIQIQRAAAEGIRVHYGCVNMPPPTERDEIPQQRWLECSPGEGVIPAVLKTGGAFAFIDQKSESATDFANHIFSRGLTVTDNTDEQETTYLWPGITTAEILGPEDTTKYFSYNASAGESIRFTVRDRTIDGQGSGGCFTVTLLDKVDQTEFDTLTSCCSEPSYLVFDATEAIELLAVAQYDSDGDSAEEGDGVDDAEVIFTIGLDVNVPKKDETTTSSTSPFTELCGGTPTGSHATSASCSILTGSRGTVDNTAGQTCDPIQMPLGTASVSRPLTSSEPEATVYRHVEI